MAPVSERQPARSKSATVRLAMLRPSRRQLRKWRRERRARRVILWSLAALVALVVGILGFGYWRENVARASEPAATVYGETITVSDLLQRVRPRFQALDAQLRLYEAQGITQAASQLNLQRARLPDQVLDSLIEDRLVRREAERRGIVVSDDEVDARIRQEIAEQEALSQPRPTATPSPSPAATAEPATTVAPDATASPTPSPTPVPTLTDAAFQGAYQAFLDRAAISDEYYREAIRAELYKEELKESLRASIPRTEEQVHARHILVDNAESLQQVRQRLADGVPFDQVAKDLSTDRGSRDKGGDLGWFGRGVMNAPFEQAAFTQPIGEIGEPVDSPNGTHIIQVLERDPERPLTEEQLAQRTDQAYQGWYAGVKGSSDVQTQLTPERRAWILRQLGSRRAA
jgi:parvulin-like peptidyl-prolyl isomerase